MFRGQYRAITVDGVEKWVEYLGKGHYATAYRDGETVYLFVKEEDVMKELLTHCQGPYLPAITTHDEQTNRAGDLVRVYSMPYYPNITAADESAWKMYRQCEKLFDQARQETIDSQPWHTPFYFYAYRINDRFVELLKAAGMDAELIASVERVNTWAANYGSGVTWEWGRRNIGVDQYGNMVLRDCLYDAEKIWKAQYRKINGYR